MISGLCRDGILTGQVTSNANGWGNLVRRGGRPPFLDSNHMTGCFFDSSPALRLPLNNGLDSSVKLRDLRPVSDVKATIRFHRRLSKTD
jgi:hypothetical protein